MPIFRFAFARRGALEVDLAIAPKFVALEGAATLRHAGMTPSGALKTGRAFLEESPQPFEAVPRTKAGHLPANLLIERPFKLLPIVNAQRLLNPTSNHRRCGGQLLCQQCRFLFQAIFRNGPRYQSNTEGFGRCDGRGA